MLNIDQMHEVHKGIKQAIATMSEKLTQLQAEIKRIQADGTRHPAWITEKSNELRSKYLGELNSILGSVERGYERLKAQHKFYGDKSLLLSKLPFTPDLAQDSAIRLRYLEEFSRMPGRLLQLVADDALADNNLPLLYMTYLTGKKGSSGWRGIDLSRVNIPNQDAALAIIEEARGLAMQAHNIVALASGQEIFGLRKLQTARALGAANGTSRG